MEIIISETYEAMSKAAAQVVAQTLNSKPNAVLGLATGSTPVGLYEELVRMHREEGLDFSQVTTFNLDEYVGLTRNNPQSYHYFMHHHLFQHINIPHAEHLHSVGHDGQLRGVLSVVRAANRGMRRNRSADPRDRFRRSHCVQRTVQFARITNADQDAGPTDDPGQRALL